MRKVWQCENVKLPCKGNIWYFLRTAIIHYTFYIINYTLNSPNTLIFQYVHL